MPDCYPDAEYVVFMRDSLRIKTWFLPSNTQTKYCTYAIHRVSGCECFHVVLIWNWKLLAMNKLNAILNPWIKIIKLNRHKTYY